MHPNPSPTVAASLAPNLLLVDLQLALDLSFSALDSSIFVSGTFSSYIRSLTISPHLAETPSFAEAKPTKKFFLNKTGPINALTGTLLHHGLSIRPSPLELGAIVACQSLCPSPLDLSTPYLLISLPSSPDIGNHCPLNLSASIAGYRKRRQLAAVFLREEGRDESFVFFECKE
ncbi:unnamed protein product [Linum trigynum]|uniref:Uncharacterized protein n=1 Tax=Linum trigynum TaxID=586398 RepID=A0AAV2DDT4_9ROSI